MFAPTSSRPSRPGIVALIAVAAAAAGLVVSGCARTAPRPEAEPRYLTLGPKENVPDYMRGTIGEYVEIGGISPLVVSGYGLVVNLENTGRDDGIPSRVRESVARTAQIRGVGSTLSSGDMSSLGIREMLSDPRVAIVRIDAVVPPGARSGDRVDVVVSALPNNTTTSLNRGVLYQADLFRGNVSPTNPADNVNKVGLARGPLVVNPVYALMSPEQVREDRGAQASLRSGVIPDGGMIQADRVFLLRLREPSRRTARAIEQRINYAFGKKVAAAQDEGLVELRLPPEFGRDWQRFVSVTTGIYFQTGSKEAGVDMANALAQRITAGGLEAVDFERISYAWEGLGPVAGPVLVPLMNDPNPSVGFAAARAAAFVGEPSAVGALASIAKDELNPHNVAAARTLGKLPPTPALLRRTRELMAVEDAAVRIATYESLLNLGDPTIIEARVGEQFLLHVVPSPRNAAPLTPVVYATRTGTPRVAILGGRPNLRPDSVFGAWDNRLTLSVPADAREPVRVFHRPVVGLPRQAVVPQDLAELVVRLGGSAPRGDVRLDLRYSDVLAILKRLGDDDLILADGRPVRLTIQDYAAASVEAAPPIPGLENIPVEPAGLGQKIEALGAADDDSFRRVGPQVGEPTEPTPADPGAPRLPLSPPSPLGRV